MAGQYRFKDINGNIVAQISASAQGAISFSGSAVDFSNASTITLGEVQLAGTASNALLLDGFDSTAFVFTSSFNTISSSVSSDLLNLKSKSSSVDISISNINTFTASNGNTSLNSYTASNDTKFTTLGSYTGSNDTKWTSISNVTSSLIQVTGSYATTGSNTFKGTQIVSASMYVQGDFVVFGSSSIQYISASSVSIGTNIVQLNTNQPAVRFGGLSVQDSGSAVGVTGSMFWDGCCNRWIYSNPSGVGYSGGVLMSGPRGSTLGNEPTLTCNYIAKSGGGDHLYDSCIQDVSGSITISGTMCTSGRICSPSITTDVVSTIGSSFASPSAAGLGYGIFGYSGVGLGISATATGPNQGIGFFTCGDFERMRIVTSGNVGVGTSCPVRKMDIVATGEQLRLSYDGSTTYTDFRNDSAGGLLVNTSGPYIINYIAGCSKMRIDASAICFSCQVCTPNLISTDTTHTTIRVGCTIVPLANYRTSDCGYGGVDFFDNGKGYVCAAKFYTFKTTAEYYGLTNDYNGSAQLALVSCGAGGGNNISFYTGTSATAKVRIDNNATCISCQLSVGPSITIGNQGGTDTTVIGGGSGVGSLLRMNYAGGSMQNLLQGNGDNYFNCLLGKLNAAGGVKFGSGATTLNYYEEGSWTPSWGGLIVGGTTSYSFRSGTYTRVGNWVFVRWGLKISSTSGAIGTMAISGLPFAGANWGSYQEPNVSVSTGNLATTSYAGLARLFIQSGGTVLEGRISNNGDTAWNTNEFNGDEWIIGEIFYNIA